MSALEWKPDEEGGFEADITVEGMCLAELTVSGSAVDEGVTWAVHTLGTYDCGNRDTREEAQAEAEAFALEMLKRGVALLKDGAS